MSSRSDCEEYLTRKLLRTSDWRRVQAARYPADMRNPRAAKELLRLATSGEEISEEQWQQLRPHFDPSSDGWSEMIAKCTRDVGFRTKPETFQAFVGTILDALAVPA
jgi:hypothetical protein